MNSEKRTDVDPSKKRMLRHPCYVHTVQLAKFGTIRTSSALQRLSSLCR